MKVPAAMPLKTIESQSAIWLPDTWEATNPIATPIGVMKLKIRTSGRAWRISTAFCRKDIPSANPANSLWLRIATHRPIAVPSFRFVPKEMPAHIAWTESSAVKRCDIMVLVPLLWRMNRSSTMSCFCPRTGWSATPMRDCEGNMMVGQFADSCGSFPVLMTVLQFMHRALSCRWTPSPRLQQPFRIGILYFFTGLPGPITSM
mmetsp:Transcript_24604/g.59218  ORF Transcript_24604/g.59218 Transcript_24604/m.59218 type:complete len:203 (-) Transcript_24604:702-1310(-)